MNYVQDNREMFTCKGSYLCILSIINTFEYQNYIQLYVFELSMNSRNVLFSSTLSFYKLLESF